jgi:hypothetical protein
MTYSAILKDRTITSSTVEGLVRIIADYQTNSVLDVVINKLEEGKKLSKAQVRRIRRKVSKDYGPVEVYAQELTKKRIGYINKGKFMGE